MFAYRKKLNACRASALTELAALILPYALLLIGAIVLGSLAIGRQEAQKAAIYAATDPHENSWAEITGNGTVGNRPVAYPGLAAGTERAQAESFFFDINPFTPNPREGSEEPVFPLDSDGDNIRALFLRLGARVTSSTIIGPNGPVTTQNTTNTSLGVTLYRDGIYEGSLIGSNQPQAVIDAVPGTEEDISGALSGWAGFSAARSGFSYAYDENLENRLPQERAWLDGEKLEGFNPEREIRGRFTVDSPSIGSEDGLDDAPGMRHFALVREDARDNKASPPRGHHHPQGNNNGDFSTPENVRGPQTVFQFTIDKEVFNLYETSGEVWQVTLPEE